MVFYLQIDSLGKKLKSAHHNVNGKNDQIERKGNEDAVTS
jgi:hypothetical protein